MSSQVAQQFASLAAKAEEVLRRQSADRATRIQVGSATCEQAAGSNEVYAEFRKYIAASGAAISCFTRRAARDGAAASRSSACWCPVKCR